MKWYSLCLLSLLTTGTASLAFSAGEEHPHNKSDALAERDFLYQTQLSPQNISSAVPFRTTINSLPITVDVLVVDDDPAIRRIETYHLHKKSLSYREESDGQGAVAFFANGNNCRLVLMDKEMPII